MRDRSVNVPPYTIVLPLHIIVLPLHMIRICNRAFFIPEHMIRNWYNRAGCLSRSFQHYRSKDIGEIERFIFMWVNKCNCH